MKNNQILESVFLGTAAVLMAFAIQFYLVLKIQESYRIDPLFIATLSAIVLFMISRSLRKIR
ncbi:hypothetical protein HYS97_03660 [Candidatus Daviesbacteria bacterium]|nr:hypothetical protein [Candidatus Daviesbacteria bacterium]